MKQKKNIKPSKNILFYFSTYIQNNQNFFIILFITILLFTVLLLISIYVFSKYINKINFENDSIGFALKNEKTIFFIDEILLFSSSNSENSTSSANYFTLQNLYQYTDIAFFIKSSNNKKTSKNTLKSLSITNINITNFSVGEPNLYFKSINNFSKAELINSNKIDTSLNFAITSSSDNELSTPVLYNNLANPITLSYINQNIKTDYTLTDTSIPISYDGSLLKRCNIPLASISSKLSFNINITNNLNEEYVSKFFIDIPLENVGTNNQISTIYSGNIHLKSYNKFIFYRVK